MLSLAKQDINAERVRELEPVVLKACATLAAAPPRRWLRARLFNVPCRTERTSTIAGIWCTSFIDTHLVGDDHAGWVAARARLRLLAPEH